MAPANLLAVRVLTLLCVGLALMCAGLAWAWQDQRQQVACWRTAAQFQQLPMDDCHGDLAEQSVALPRP